MFVATKHVFCRGKHAFVATKMILVAAPANDINITSKLGKIAKSMRPVFVLLDL